MSLPYQEAWGIVAIEGAPEQPRALRERPADVQDGDSVQCPHANRQARRDAVISYATALGGRAIGAAVERADLAPNQIEHVVMGQVLQAGQGQIPSRQAQIKAGIPIEVSSEIGAA
jgi:hypothetical protein